MSNAELDWDDLRAFLTVLRRGSLAAAARSLNVTQPTMRRRLDSLESALDTRLFTRTPTGLTPTNTARALETHARTMSAAADAFARGASAETDRVAGSVRITASHVIGAEVLPSIVTGLRQRHPGLAIELSLDDGLQDLSHQAADIAVRMAPPTQAALVAKKIGIVPVGLYAHATYIASAGKPMSLGALKDFALIGPDHDTLYLEALREGLNLGRRDFALRTDSQLAQLAAIRAGFGIGICQVRLADRDPRLVRVLPDFDDPLPTWLVMHEDLRDVARVRAAFDHLAHALSVHVTAAR